MKNTIIALAVIVAATPAVAQQSKDDGFRLGVGYTSVSIPSSSISPTGVILTAGYDINKVVGISANYVSVSDSINGRGSDYELDGRSYGADMDIGWTFTSNSDVSAKIYGIAGINHTTIDEKLTQTYCSYWSCNTYKGSVSTSENFVRMGVGTRITFQDTFGVTVQYAENYWTEDTSVHYDQLDIIASYRF